MKKIFSIIAIIFFIIIPIIFINLPHSQVNIINDWEKKFGNIHNAIFSIKWKNDKGLIYGFKYIINKILGISDTYYFANNKGYITELVTNKFVVKNSRELTGFSQLRFLEYLDLSGCTIEDTLDVSNFKMLKILILKDTKINTIYGIENLTDLQKLELENSTINTSSLWMSLGKLKTLNYFDVSGTILPDSINLSSLNSLEYLFLENTGIIVLKGLDSLLNLKVIDISQNKIEHIDFSLNTNLERIALKNTSLRKIYGLQSLNKLWWLNLEESPIEEITIPKHVKFLDLSGTNITNFSFLNTFNSIKTLNLRNMDLKNFKGFYDYAKLEDLDLQSSVSVNLYAVALIVSLEKLTLDYTDVTDFHILYKLINLKVLNVRGLKNVDMIPFNSLKNLQGIDIRDTEYKREELQKHLNHPALIFDGTSKTKYPRIMAENTVKTFIKFSIVLLICLTVCLLPIERIIKLSKVILLKKILIRIFALSLYILILLFLANLHIPIVSKIFLISAIVIGSILGLILPYLTVVQSKPDFIIKPNFIYLKIFMSNLVGELIGLPILVIGFIMTIITISSTDSKIVFIILSVIIIFTFLIQILLGFYWKRHLKKLNRLLSNNKNEKDLFLEINLNQKFKVFFATHMGNFFFNLGEIFDDMGLSLKLLTCTGITMLYNIEINKIYSNKLSGILVYLPKSTYAKMKYDELIYLYKWLTSIYNNSICPIWIVTDWDIENVTYQSTFKEKHKVMALLAPYVIFEKVQKRVSNLSISNNGLTRLQQETLRLNQKSILTSLGNKKYDSFLKNGFSTSVRLYKRIFALPNPQDRIDQIMKTIESSIAFFALSLSLEYNADSIKLENRKKMKINKALMMNLNKPTFQSWESLISTFCKYSNSDLTTQLNEKLNLTAGNDSKDLFKMITQIQGAKHLDNLSNREEFTLKSYITLFRYVRNLTTARGPLTQRVNVDFYQIILSLAHQFIIELPWEYITLVHIDSTNTHCFFKGMQPYITKQNDRIDKRAGLFLYLTNYKDLKKKLIDASIYFHSNIEDFSIALYMDVDRYLDPISGLHYKGKEKNVVIS